MALRHFSLFFSALCLCHILPTNAFNIVGHRGHLFKQSTICSPKNSHVKSLISSSYTNVVHTKSPFNKEFKLELSSSNNESSDSIADDPFFSWKSVFAVVSSQSLLIAVAAIAAGFVSIPNYGLGQGFLLDGASIQSGILYTIPLFSLAFIFDYIEDSIPPLKYVTSATQRSVLALLGSTR